jgi:thymidylate synthase (FAD)
MSIIETEFADDMLEARYRGSGDIDALHEFAGRACYKSWSKPNSKTATNRGYLEHIEEVGHFSVLEHGQVTFYVEGVSRALLLELERHGRNSHLSFSVESQRYVSTSKHHPDPVIPPLFDELEDVQEWGFHVGALKEHYEESLRRYDECFERLREAGVLLKQAREAARAFLPNATPVDLVVTADIRGWREVIEKRNDPAADKEIQRLAKEVLNHLRYICPNSVQDLPDEPPAKGGDTVEIRTLSGEVVRTISTRPLEDADDEGWGQ